MAAWPDTLIPLPAALQPWHPWLRWFQPELAAQLGTLVQRLHPLLGRFRGRLHGGEPEPEGLGELRSRGPYERLLTTEWLLAEAWPEEFLRRATMGEHLFLAPHAKGRRAERVIVVLFDAGPLQLGAPRLAHLALWILLARRAQEAGGTLRWGVLQAPDELHVAQGEPHLQQLLKRHSFVLAEASHWRQWGEVLAAHPAAECWVVAPDPPLQTPSWLTHALRLRRTVRGDALEVALREQHREQNRERTLQLPLPQAAAGAALLRGRFDTVQTAVAVSAQALRLSSQRAPLFSVRGQLVVLPLLRQPGVAIFRIPRAQEAWPRTPRRQLWATGVEPLALCVAGKRVVGVLGDATHLHFWHVRGLGAQPRPAPAQLQAPPGAAAWLPAAWLRQTDGQRVCMLDAAGRLLCWEMAAQPPCAPPEVRCLHTEVCGLVQFHDDSLVYLQCGEAGLQLFQLHATGPPLRLQSLGPGTPDMRVWFAGGAAWARGQGACAVRMQTEPQEIWHLHVPAGSGADAGWAVQRLQLPSGWRAVGLVCGAQEGQNPRGALVMQSPDRMTLYRLHAGGREPLYVAPSRMLRCSVCPNTGRVAVLTVQRQLIVYDTAEQAVRLFLHGVALETEHEAA